MQRLSLKGKGEEDPDAKIKEPNSNFFKKYGRLNDPKSITHQS